MKILALIPARAGSQTVKNKNIKIYKKKPLIYHSIAIAKKSKLINRIIVSTDSKLYANICKRFGAEIPFLRPKNISNSSSTDKSWVMHATNFLKRKENYIPDIIVHLRPTTPDRDAKVIDAGIKFFLKNYSKSTSMRSVSIFSQPPQKLFKMKNKYLYGFFNKTLKGEYHNYPRQNFSQTYLPNGYIDILKPEFFLNSKYLHGNKILAYITERTNDIDLPIDFIKN